MHAGMAAAAVAWGSVSDWVAGLATAIAVVVALVFSLRAERHQRDAALAAVHAWFEVVRGPGGGSTRANLRVVNDTAFPIYEWSVTLRWPARGDGGGTIDLTTGQQDHGLLPPGNHNLAFEPGDLALPGNDAEVQVDLWFRDASGRSRHRTPTGQLVGRRSR